MRVLIVGCGYVGLPLGQALIQAGHQVSGLRRRAHAAEELHRAGITPIVADITRRTDLDGISGAFDWVINTVASSGGNSTGETTGNMFCEPVASATIQLSFASVSRTTVSKSVPCAAGIGTSATIATPFE